MTISISNTSSWIPQPTQWNNAGSTSDTGSCNVSASAGPSSGGGLFDAIDRRSPKWA